MLSALLLFVLLVFPACAAQSGTADTEQGSSEKAQNTRKTPEKVEKKTEPAASKESGRGDPGGSKKEQAGGGSEETVEAVLPEDVLSDKELKESKPRKYKSFYEESDEPPAKLGTTDSSVGAIPAVKPFNFGRDPGGPEDKTLYLTVPKLGLQGIPVFDEVSEETLKESVAHVPVTGYPWQDGANTYIAGHRVGYPGTGSYYVFFYLDSLVEGDEILLQDAAGGEYRYRVTKQVVVGPDAVEIMEPQEGKNLVSLQTCTLPDYKERLIVQGELVEPGA